MAEARIETLVILGAGGDLTSRLLLPGLASLLASSRGERIRLIGVDRDAMTDERWRARVNAAFSTFRSDLGERVARDSFYLRADATSADDLAAVLAASTGRTAVYFALPPAITEKACTTLATMDLPPGIVLALEKPFGEDVRTARALNRLLQKMVPEEHVFRVDHLPRQVDDPQPDRAPVREPHLRAAALRREHRPHRDHRRGVDRPRGPRRVLRPCRRADRHDPEPPAAGARPRHDGGAVECRLGGPARCDGAGAARHAAVEAGRHREPPRPLQRRHRRPPQAAAVHRRAGSGRVPAHRDLGRDDGRDRHLALGGRPDRPAHRQGDRAAAAGDPLHLSRGPAPADRVHRARPRARSCASASIPRSSTST